MKDAPINPLTRLRRSRLINQSSESVEPERDSIVPRQYSKRASTNLRNDTTKLKRLKSDSRIKHRVVRKRDNKEKNCPESNFEFNTNEGNANFKARFKTKHIKKGVLKATFKGEIILNKFTKKKKAEKSKKKSAKEDSKKKLKRVQSRKCVREVERELFKSEIEHLKTNKDNFFVKKELRLNSIKTKDDMLKVQKNMINKVSKRRSPVANDKKRKTKQKSGLKKVKSVQFFEKRKGQKKNEGKKINKNFLKSMKTSNKNYEVEEKEKKMVIVVNKPAKSKVKIKSLKNKCKSPQKVKKESKKNKTGKIISNLKGKKKLKSSTKKTGVKVKKPSSTKKQKNSVKVIIKTKRSQSRKKIKCKKFLISRKNNDTKNDNYIEKIKRIQNWWRHLKNKYAYRKTIKKSELHSLMVKSFNSENEEKESQKKISIIKPLPKEEPKKQLKMVEKNDLESYQNLLDLYNNLQNDQLSKWKGFFNKVSEIEKEKKADNHLIKKVKKDSLNAINFLMGTMNKEGNKSQIFGEPSFYNNLSDSKQILHSFSIDNKNSERFLVPANKIKQKHIYDCFKDNYLNKSGKNSKSLISFKNGTEKSFKNIKELEKNENKGLLKFIKCNKVNDNSNFNNYDTLLKTSINNKMVSKFHETTVDHIYEYLIDDMIKDKTFRKLFNSKKLQPGVNISILTIHKHLNEISEHIIFNFLPKLKNNLQDFFSFDLKNLKKKGEKKDILCNDFYTAIKEGIETPDFKFVSQNKIITTFNRCLFDSLNEAISKSLNTGLLCNLPYTNQLAFKESRGEEDYLDDISAITCLEKACNTVLGWNDTMCGLLISDIKANKGFNEQEYVNQIREECMDKFILEHIRGDKEDWMVSGKDIGRVAVEISLLIEETLFQDLVVFLKTV